MIGPLAWKLRAAAIAGAVIAGMGGAAVTAGGCSTSSQKAAENMERNTEQAQDPNQAPSRQDQQILPPP